MLAGAPPRPEGFGAALTRPWSKDQRRKRKCSQKKKWTSKTFSGDLQKKLSKKFFSADLQNFNHSKNSAALDQKTGQFLRT